MRACPRMRCSWRGLIGLALRCAGVCAVLAGCAIRSPAPHAAPEALVLGVALTRERVVLPPEAVFEATLLDLSEPDQPPVVLGRQRLLHAGSPPYAIQIAYPLARWLPQGRYELRASVTLQERLLLSSAQRHPVLYDAALRHLTLELARAPQQPAQANAAVPLALTHWRLVEIERQALPRAAAGAPTPYLVLQAEPRRATGSGGCNRFLADYDLQGEQLHWRRLHANARLCLQSSALEDRFFTALAAVQGFWQQGRQLLLLDAKGRTRLRFDAAETALQ